MLSAHGLTCVRGDRPLFAGVDLSVGPGEWLHVRGANGSGKTSLLRLLAGLSQPEAGQVHWNGEPIGRIAQDYHRALLFLGHHAAVKEELTGAENLQLSAELDGGAIGRAEIHEALGRFGLKGREDLPVRVLSAGQKRRVLLARLMTRKAKLWVLDEPFTALDTRAVDMLGSLAREHLAQGGMAVVTSHQPVPLEGGQVLELSASNGPLRQGPVL
ncbi:MAG: heme exporter protein CcmA [Ramlibacter sp.]|jgi:heme exporter protein A|nr:heme exporter protein CcmA [Ramlibacter sp.]